MKSALNKLKDYGVPSSIISRLTNEIDMARSSSGPVTVKVTDKIYRFLEWSNIEVKVLDPTDFGFKKPNTISIGFVSGAVPMPVMMGGPSIGVVGATGVAGIIAPMSGMVVTSSSSRKSTSKSSDYFHDVLSWREAKAKIGHSHRYRQFHQWCRDEKSWNFSFSDNTAKIPGRYVIEFNKKKWGLRKKKSCSSAYDMLPSMS